MRKNLLFTAIAWLLIFGLFEGGIRIYDVIDAIGDEKRHKTTNWSSLFLPHPYATYVASPAHGDHTEQGFRGPDLYETEAAGLRIVALGGSSTYGTRVAEADAYPRQLEHLLRKRLDRPVEVINAGLGGYGTANIIALLALRIAHLKPDIAIFYVGFNDAWNRILYAGFETDYGHAQRSWLMPERPLWRASRLLDEVAKLLGHRQRRDPHLHDVAWHPKSGTAADNWNGGSDRAFRANPRTLVAVARAHGMKAVLVTQASDFAGHPLKADNPLWQEALATQTRAIRDIAAETETLLIDIQAEMNDKADYFADVLHMSAAGNARRAELIADGLAPLLGK